MYELPDELPNNRRLRIFRKLGNFKKIPEMLEFDGEYSAIYPKPRFSRKSQKN